MNRLSQCYPVPSFSCHYTNNSQLYMIIQHAMSLETPVSTNIPQYTLCEYILYMYYIYQLSFIFFVIYCGHEQRAIIFRVVNMRYPIFDLIINYYVYTSIYIYKHTHTLHTQRYTYLYIYIYLSLLLCIIHCYILCIHKRNNTR